MNKVIVVKLATKLGNDTNEALQEYALDKISSLHRELEAATDTSRIFFVQGQIKELRSLFDLKKDVLETLKIKE